MRVLHVNKFLYRRGGAEGYMLDLAGLQRGPGARGRASSGCSTRTTTSRSRSSAGSPARSSWSRRPEGVKGKAAAAARMIWSTSARRGMAHVLEEFRPDIVHCHNIYHQLSPSMLEPIRKAGVPCVMTLHDYKLACPSYQLLDHGDALPGLRDRRLGHPPGSAR